MPHVPCLAEATKPSTWQPLYAPPTAMQFRPVFLAALVAAGAQDTVMVRPVPIPLTLRFSVTPARGWTGCQVPLTRSTTNACPV